VRAITLGFRFVPSVVEEDGMGDWSRRDVLKTGMVAPAAAAAMPPLPEEQQAAGPMVLRKAAK
jgi:hypothetical protein